MDRMPSLLLQLLTVATPKQHLLLEATHSSSNNMDPLMANKHQVSNFFFLNSIYLILCGSASNYKLTKKIKEKYRVGFMAKRGEW